MNCKKGDMAVVVVSYAANEGKVVTCLEYLGDVVRVNVDGKLHELVPGNWWRVDRKLNRYNNMEKIVPDCFPYCRDEYMMPIGNVDEPMKVEETAKEPA